MRAPRPFAWLLALSALWPAAAMPEVRLGRHVYIGGHDFSHQTYGPHRRAIIHLYPRRPHRAGCRWYPAGSIHDGMRLAAPTRICNLGIIGPRRR